MDRYSLRAVIAALFIGLFVVVPVTAQKYSGSPVTKERLVRAIRSKQFAVPVVVKQIQESGVDFELTAAAESELRGVNANQRIIDAVRANYRYAAVTPTRGGIRPAPPPVIERDATGERYEQLYYQGIEVLTRLQTAYDPSTAIGITRSAIGYGEQAIKLSPTRPEAYALVAASHLFGQNFSEAERYGEMALDRGGSLAFLVYHLAGEPHPETLHIGKGFLTVESNQKFFQFNGREASNPRMQGSYAVGMMQVPVFSFSTFKDGRSDVWNFAPGYTAAPQEAAMIIRLIQKYSIGSK
jgi:hypothetical protein